MLKYIVLLNKITTNINENKHIFCNTNKHLVD